MGISGVKLNITKNSLVAALKRAHGVKSDVCKALDIAHPTLQKYITEFSLHDLVAELRESFCEELLDSAENVLVHAFRVKDTDLANALKATLFVLNNKGRARGYTPPNAQVQSEQGPPVIESTDYSAADQAAPQFPSPLVSTTSTCSP